MSNTFATVILPCVIIAALAMLFIAQILRNQTLEAELAERQAENPAIPLFRQAIERLANERKEIEVHLFGEIRNADIDGIIDRIKVLKAPRNIHTRIESEFDDPADAAGIAAPIVKDTEHKAEKYAALSCKPCRNSNE